MAAPGIGNALLVPVPPIAVKGRAVVPVVVADVTPGFAEYPHELLPVSRSLPVVVAAAFAA